MRVYKYVARGTGPGSGGPGNRFYSLTEALAFVRYMLKEGRAVVVSPIEPE